MVFHLYHWRGWSHLFDHKRCFVPAINETARNYSRISGSWKSKVTRLLLSACFVLQCHVHCACVCCTLQFPSSLWCDNDICDIIYLLFLWISARQALPGAMRRNANSFVAARHENWTIVAMHESHIMSWTSLKYLHFCDNFIVFKVLQMPKTSDFMNTGL